MAPMRTQRPSALRQAAARARTGRWAEDFVADRVTALGWRVLARNVRVGRAELDLVAIDPGPPAALVVVEVRANRQSAFGAPEAGVDRRKLRSVYGGALGLRAAGALPDGRRLPPLPLRVDLFAVEAGPALARETPGTTVRHLRGVIG